MEPSPNLPAGDAPEPSPPSAGELIVQNGRQSGARRALTVPLTLIGRAPGCDVRLNAKGVHLLHCALVLGPSGLVVRNLQDQGGTLVNGEPVGSAILCDGDLLTVGPFHFRIRLPPAAPPADAEALRREREALRIQAAAVAAQQAALTEEEGRLQQKRVALQKQEEQLAAHLEERRHHLVQLREQVALARRALRQERAAHAARTAEVQRELERAHRQNIEMQRRVQLRRERLLKIYRGLQRRARRLRDQQEAVLRRRESELARQRHELEKQAERLQQERAALAEQRLRLNGEMELSRRRMEHARQRLAAERAAWEQERVRQRAELAERSHALDQRAANLARAERDLARRSQEWEEARYDLEREIEGLQHRARNQRRLLVDQQQELARLGALLRDLRDRAQPPLLPVRDGPMLADAPPVPTLPAGPPIEGEGEALPPPDWMQRRAVLERLAAELADQRLCLAEQFERLLRAQERWQRERDEATAALEAMSVRLQERERALEAREQALAPSEAALQQRREELAQVRFHLDAWRARLAAREAAWEGEREALLADLAGREKLVQQQQAALAELRQHWLQRRQQEMEQLQAERARHQEAFQRFTRLWTDCLRRHAALEQDQRVLAEKALALEQYRLECIGRSENSVVAEKQLERLRRRWAALAAAAERRLTRDRQAVEAELTSLEERFHRLQQLAADLTRRELEWSDRQTEWERGEAVFREERARLEQALHSTRAQRDAALWQLGRAREEMERMALTLLEESGPTPAMQAA